MFGWRISLWAVIVLAALYFLYLVRSILPPFVAAILIAVLLDPGIRKLQDRGIRRPRAVWTVFLLFFLAITAAGIVVAPGLTSQVGNLKDKLEEVTGRIALEEQYRNPYVRWNPRNQSASDGLSAQVDKFLMENRGVLDRFGLPTTSAGMMAQYVEPHRQEITNAVEAFFNSLLGIVSSFGSQFLLMLFTPVFALMILLDIERFRARSVSWIPPSIRGETIQLVKDIGNVFVRYLRGVTIVLIWYALLAAVLLTVLGAPYSILLAVLFALIYLIPYVGPLLNAILLLSLTAMSGRTENILFSLGSPFMFAVTITLIYFAIMLFFDPLVYTRLVGNSVGLHPVVSFFVVFSGAALFGPIGMILAFPVAGSVKVVLDRLIRITSDGSEGLNLPVIPIRHRTVHI